MSAQRAQDQPAGCQQRPQALLTESVLTLELAGTPVTRVEELVTHAALQVRIHPAACAGRCCVVAMVVWLLSFGLNEVV